jgi:hypothetical protein
MMRTVGDEIAWPGLAAIVLAMLLAPAHAQESLQGAAGPTFTILYENDPIESGYVVCDGKHLELPYTIVRRDDAAFLNGHPLPRMPRSGSGFDVVSQLQQCLQNDGMVLIQDGKVYAFGPARTTQIFTALLSESSAEAKVSEIKILLNGQFSAQTYPWAELVGLFASDENFASRVREFNGAGGEAHREAAEAGAGGMSSSLRSAMNMGGMALAVLALGTLFLYRPGCTAKWSTRDAAGDGYRLLPRFVAVVVILSLFDLTYTVLAGRAGGFWEMNPLGGLMMDNPAALVTFKLLGTATGVAILWRLRPYCGAQLAAWWICLVYTVLSFRWAIFNSLFFG